MTIHHWMTQTGCVFVCVFVMALTLSTPTFLKDTCSSLKLWMNSCSSLAPNLTFFRGIEFWKSMSMNWQYAAPDNNDSNTATHGSTAWPGAAGLYNHQRYNSPSQSLQAGSQQGWGEKPLVRFPQQHLADVKHHIHLHTHTDIYRKMAALIKMLAFS